LFFAEIDLMMQTVRLVDKRPNYGVGDSSAAHGDQDYFSGWFSQKLEVPPQLETDQLKCADKIAEVKSVGFYHGGDVLYEIKGVPSVWHE
jgi:hypothetical protein